MEPKESWQIIASGTTVKGIDRHDVENNLKQKLNFNDTKIEKLLNGRKKVIRKGLTNAAAEKYVMTLRKLGVDVDRQQMPGRIDMLAAGLSLEPIPEDKAMAPTSTDAPAQQQSQARLDPGQMQCPKCHTVQPRATECMSCGIIIDRFQSTAKSGPTRPPKQGKTRSLSFDWRIAGGFLLIGFIAIYFSMMDSQPFLTTPEAKAQAAAVRKSMSNTWPEMSRIKQLVDTGNYYEVEKIYLDLHDRSQTDISWEDSYLDTVTGVSSYNGFTLNALNNWVNASHSAFAYLARGAYHYAAALDARGNNWASDTSAARFKEQSRLANKAKKDIEKALSLNHKIIPAYAMLIWLSTAQATDIDKERVLADALAAAPATFQVRYYYMQTIEPKWGGSYAAMDAFADESVAALRLNPRLWLLKALVDEQKGNAAYMKGDCDSSITHYSNALEYGVYPIWLNQRAYCFTKTGDYDLALIDLNRTLDFYPGNSYATKVKAIIEAR